MERPRGKTEKECDGKWRPVYPEMTGALRKDKQMTGQEQKHMQLKDIAENGPNKEKIIDETTRNLPS